MSRAASDIQKRICENFESDIPVVDMDYNRNMLIAAGGRVFQEVTSNIWREKKSDAVYLGTARHGGGIVLRLLFVRLDGKWFNATTGKEAPFKDLVSSM